MERPRCRKTGFRVHVPRLIFESGTTLYVCKLLSRIIISSPHPNGAHNGQVRSFILAFLDLILPDLFFPILDLPDLFYQTWFYRSWSYQTRVLQDSGLTGFSLPFHGRPHQWARLGNCPVREFDNFQILASKQLI